MPRDSRVRANGFLFRFVLFPFLQVMSCCLFSDLCCVASITKQLDLRVWLKDWLNGMLRSFFAANSDQIVPRSRVFLLICTSLQRLISAGKSLFFL